MEISFRDKKLAALTADENRLKVSSGNSPGTFSYASIC